MMGVEGEGKDDGVWRRVKQLARKCRGKDAASSGRGELEAPHPAGTETQYEIVATDMYKPEREGEDGDGDHEGSSTEKEGVDRVIAARQARLQRAGKLLAKLNSSRDIPGGGKGRD